MSLEPLKEIVLFSFIVFVSEFCDSDKVFEAIIINIRHIKLIKDGINNATHFLIGIWFLEGKIF